MKLAYTGLLLFVLVYCVRPGDWIPGATLVPFAKIAALIALAGFVPSLFLQAGAIQRMPWEMRYLLLLFLQLALAVPFSIWRGGSFEVVFEGFAKVVLIALCTSMAVTSLRRLRRLLFLQTGAVAVMVFLAASSHGRVLVDSAGQTRLVGVVGGIFGDPNDFAFAIALVLPVAVAFLLETRNPLLKVFWAGAVVTMAYVVIKTLSRGGLLAVVVALSMSIWEFGVRGRRYYLVVLAVIMAAGLVVAAPGQFAKRVESMFDLSQDATGSGWARRTLLIRSTATTLEHPLVGVGPGNFGILSGFWHGAHNTYTQLSSEAGIPALILFILILRRAAHNVRHVKKLAGKKGEFQELTSAIRASLACYIVGAFFLDTAYHFFPYLLVGYASALRQIAENRHGDTQNSGQRVAETGSNGKPYASRQERKLARIV